MTAQAMPHGAVTINIGMPTIRSPMAHKPKAPTIA